MPTLMDALEGLLAGYGSEEDVGDDDDDVDADDVNARAASKRRRKEGTTETDDETRAGGGVVGENGAKKRQRDVIIASDEDEQEGTTGGRSPGRAASSKLSQPPPATRARSFPHVEGNFATHVYLPVRLPASCRAPLIRTLRECQRRMPVLQPCSYEGSSGGGGDSAKNSSTTADDAPAARRGSSKEADIADVPSGLHVSLSRVFPIRREQWDPLISALRGALRSKDSFDMTLGHMTVFVNDDRTR